MPVDQPRKLSQLEKTIAAIAREEELGRRRARAQILTNHAALLEGEASEANKPGVQAALASLKRHQQEEATEAILAAWSRTSYLRRVWLAICGKPPI